MAFLARPVSGPRAYVLSRYQLKSTVLLSTQQPWNFEVSVEEIIMYCANIYPNILSRVSNAVNPNISTPCHAYSGKCNKYKRGMYSTGQQSYKKRGYFLSSIVRVMMTHRTYYRSLDLLDNFWVRELPQFDRQRLNSSAI